MTPIKLASACAASVLNDSAIACITSSSLGRESHHPVGVVAQHDEHDRFALAVWLLVAGECDNHDGGDQFE